MNFNVAELNKKIQFQYPVQVSDAMGGYTITWTNFGSAVWAAIWPVSAKQVIETKSESTEITHRIRIRYKQGIRTSFRIQYKNRIFTIYGPPINVDEKNEWMDIVCKEVK